MSRHTGKSSAFHSPLLAWLLLVAVYAVGGWADNSTPRDFSQTPVADLPAPHSKGQRPQRLLWTATQEDASQCVPLRPATDPPVLGQSASGFDEIGALRAAGQSPRRHVAAFTDWRTRNPRDPPAA